MTDTPENVGAIMAVLDDVMDPEIPVISITDLGIVRNVDARRVLITPTYSGCPASHAIEMLIRNALDSNGFREVMIETTLSPPWTTDWMTEAGKAALLAYGIAPPHDVPTATCPQCGSTDTEEVSRFGSTPCKSLWRCKSCLEPFDRIKGH